jgi:hypothetical protein
MGFLGDGSIADITNITDQNNSFRLKKVRIRLNGIYIDGGDVKEFQNVDTAVNGVGTDTTTAWDNHMGYMESYEEYCCFFGQY